MKLHFDSKQEFQIEAVKAITDIFEGQPLNGNDFDLFSSLRHPKVPQPGENVTDEILI
ncbi:MAG: hypothetical protein M0Q53_19870 [Prolixibacteraceae bacterium]|jgi:hypothetical protein|nr:hypothetical protein [Prolixibacteraceae bacterium]